MSSAIPISDDYLSLIRRFPLRVITTREVVQQANELALELTVREIQNCLSSGEKAYFEVLSKLIKDFEEKHFSVPKMKPREALLYVMEQADLTQADIVRIADGHRSNISAFLAGKRALSKEAAIRLARYFKLNLEIFLDEG